MDNQTLVTIIWSLTGAVGTVFLGLVAFGLKALITATFKNTMAINNLNQHIEQLLKIPAKLEKVQFDIDNAHAKIRSLGGEK